MNPLILSVDHVPTRASVYLRQAAVVVGWAMVLALVMSTQFLFQPFIWRNFGLADIASGWIGILRDRLAVATCVATALAAFGATPQRRLGMRVILQAAAIIVGATVGELLLQAIASQDDRQDLLSLVGRIGRWTVVGGSIAALSFFWQSGSALAAAAEETRIDDARLRQVAATIQLEMLKRQIEPHFLFNTLATVRRLQETDPSRGQLLLRRLFDYMSATIGETETQPETLRTEMRLVTAYLEVCAARMTGPLTVRCDIPDALAGIAFPPLILATLAENAIKHGIDASTGGEILIDATARGGMVAIALSDTGVGFGKSSGGSGIGLANISERLRLLYGPAATLTLSANSPSGVRATVLVARRAAP